MKLALPLAVDIADSVVAASRETFSIADKARELVAEHPEADATVGEVADALHEELSALSAPLIMGRSSRSAVEPN